MKKTVPTIIPVCGIGESCVQYERRAKQHARRIKIATDRETQQQLWQKYSTSNQHEPYNSI